VKTLPVLLFGDELLRALRHALSTAAARGVSSTTLPSQQSSPVRGSNRTCLKVNCRSTAIWILLTFQELSQESPVGREETCRMRTDGRQWTSL